MEQALEAFADCFRVDALLTPTAVSEIELSAPADRNLRRSAASAGVSALSDDAKTNFRPEKPVAGSR